MSQQDIAKYRPGPLHSVLSPLADIEPSEVLKAMFSPVLPDELAFAMTLFFAAANGQATPAALTSHHPDRLRAKDFFLSITFPLNPLAPQHDQQENALNTTLYASFIAVWDHYHAHPLRPSLCARTLGFCYLMERSRGEIVARWTTQTPNSPQQVLLAPAVIEALAAVPLTDRGTLVPSSFVAAVDAVHRLSDCKEFAEDPTPSSAWPPGICESAALTRNYDWTSSPLGPTDAWPQSLRTAVEITLACRFPMIVLWGPDLVQLYNDAYSDIMGSKHPAGLGQPTAQCWPEVWHFNEPIYQKVRQGESLTFENQLFPIHRYGFLENAFFTLCYSPLRDESSTVEGVLVTVFETTPRARPDTHPAKVVPLPATPGVLMQTNFYARH